MPRQPSRKGEAVAHPNEDRIREGYAAFTSGDFDHIRNEFFDPDIQWHVEGRSQIAGDYRGHDEVFGFFAKLIELSAGTLQLEIHEVLANDEHGIAMIVNRAEREGRSYEDKAVHSFHMRDGKVTEFWGFVADQYAADEFWS
jgi:ketosteroid isomerase-like protein